MSTRRKNQALVYLRRSSTRQEMSLGEQLKWAQSEAARLGLYLDATAEDLALMQARRLHSYKGIRLDDGITGADLSRPGFRALIDDARRDKSVSHLLIYRRDRLARPEVAGEMMLIEREIRQKGVTFVFQGETAEPLVRGQSDLLPDVAMLMAYSESGDFLRKHAERVIQAQRHLALEGFRTGGSPPYGFGRALFDASGTFLENLPPKRTIRQPGCHVRLVPVDLWKIQVWLYILELKELGWGYKRIAQHLNNLGIPSPGAGSSRTDQGVKHLVSGRWNHNTVRELCANKAILGLQEYGRRSEGVHRRLGVDGPRLLDDADRINEESVRVIMNPSEFRIEVATGGKAFFDKDRWEKIQRETCERSKSQRGVPRAQDPARYPLSCKLVDLTDGCGSILYGMTNGGRRVYKCGRYMRTAGAECQSNTIDAEATLRFTLLTLRQLVDRHGNRDRLRALLEERARREITDPPRRRGDLIKQTKTHLEGLKSQLEIVARRMATEPDDARYQAIAAEYDRLRGEIRTAEEALAAEQSVAKASSGVSLMEEVEAAMGLLDSIGRITSDDTARAEINPLLGLLGLRLGLTFEEAIKGKKRAVRRLVSGLMVFGDRPLPVPLHGAANLETRDQPEGLDLDHEEPSLADRAIVGPTSRQMADGESSEGRADGVADRAGDRVPDPATPEQMEPPRPVRRREEISITKVNRGERI